MVGRLGSDSPRSVGQHIGDIDDFSCDLDDVDDDEQPPSPSESHRSRRRRAGATDDEDLDIMGIANTWYALAWPRVSSIHRR